MRDANYELPKAYIEELPAAMLRKGKGKVTIKHVDKDHLKAGDILF